MSPDRSPADVRELACVVHVHSTYSDGTASVEELIEATRASGRDFLLLTDHDTLGAARGGWEGRHGDVSLIVGHEVSLAGGHLLAFGLDREVRRRGRRERDVLEVVEREGGLSFAAHPFSSGSALPPLIRRGLGRPHAWDGLALGGYTGVELWSLTTDAAESWRSVGEAIAWMRDPEAMLDGPPPHHVAAWDALCRERRVVAIGGLDSHARGIRLPGGRVLSPMPNERYFRMLATYAQIPASTPPEFGAEREALFEALREGRCLLGIDATAPARGFRFWAESADGRIEMGGESDAHSCELHVELPHPGRIRVLSDGEEVAGTEGTRLVHPVEGPGVFRIEARRHARGRERAWILSNPIYLR